MSPLRQVLLGGVLLLALGVLLWTQHLRTQAEEARAELASQQQLQADQRIERQALTITQLDQALQAERAAQAELRTLQNQLRRGLAERERIIKELSHDDPSLRAWIAEPLPGAARGLRERPALTGAEAFREWMSRSGAVQPAGDSPGQ